MITLDLIEFGDLVRSKEITDEILRQNPHLKIPVPLKDIAEQAGITDIVYKPLDGLQGALVANEYKSEGIILINEKSIDDQLYRHNFTLGHELGHFMLPRHGHLMECSIESMQSPDIKSIEYEANQFASEILMPRKYFQQHPLFDREPSLSNIIDLASEFNVSVEACAIRYTELQHEALMIIFYKDRRFRYFRKSKNMPFYFQKKPKNGVSAPNGSLTKTISFNGEYKFQDDSLDSSVWFNESKDYRLPEEVIEEVYLQNNGYSVTMLRFEDELEEIEI